MIVSMKPLFLCRLKRQARVEWSCQASDPESCYGHFMWQEPLTQLSLPGREIWECLSVRGDSPHVPNPWRNLQSDLRHSLFLRGGDFPVQRDVPEVLAARNGRSLRRGEGETVDSWYQLIVAKTLCRMQAWSRPLGGIPRVFH